MASYQILDLERLTGIKAHTLRIWEKRYDIIQPYRTATNRRYYNDDQVRKLLNVSTLLANGLKISKIASLTETELNESIQTIKGTGTAELISGTFINDLIEAMLRFDETAFEKIFAAAATRFGMYDAMLQVFYPFLNKAGMLWSVNETAPVQEHFATSIIVRKLMAAIDGLKPPTIKDKRFVLMLPGQEWHEMGLLFANYILRAKGVETIYLGQNVPDENIDEMMALLQPQYLLLFFISPRPTDEISNYLKKIAHNHPATQLLVAGGTAIQPAENVIASNLKILYTVADLETLI